MSGYSIHIPTSGGKAGKGMNDTSTVQVRKDSMLKKQFRFKMCDPSSRQKAVEKANQWIASQAITSTQQSETDSSP